MKRSHLREAQNWQNSLFIICIVILFGLRELPSYTKNIVCVCLTRFIRRPWDKSAKQSHRTLPRSLQMLIVIRLVHSFTSFDREKSGCIKPINKRKTHSIQSHLSYLLRIECSISPVYSILLIIRNYRTWCENPLSHCSNVAMFIGHPYASMKWARQLNLHWFTCASIPHICVSQQCNIVCSKREKQKHRIAPSNAWLARRKRINRRKSRIYVYVCHFLFLFQRKLLHKH